MSRAAFAVACALLSLGLTAGALTSSEPAAASHCPLAPDPDALEMETAGCYYPEVSVSANPSSVTVNSGTSTISYTITGADPSQGCYKSGGWSGNIAVDASGNASGQGVVGPFSTTGTINFNVTCPADPVNGFAGATVTINPSGGGGGGGGSGCTENNTSQLYSELVGMTTVPQTLNPGQTFTANITFKNAGQCTWTAANGYKLGSQNPENNTSWGTSRALLGSSDSIAPGQSKTFVLNAKAPSTSGAYGFQWRMVREGVNWFGPATPNVAIYVDPSIEQYALTDSKGVGAGDLPIENQYNYRGDSCRWVKPWRNWKTLFGVLLWEYHMDIKFCWKGGKITSVFRNRYPVVAGFPGNPWGFEGHQSSSCNTENCADMAGGSSARIATGGKFKACALFVVFCNQRFPYIEVEITGTGGVRLVRANS